HTVYLSSSYCFSFNNRWIDQLTLQADWQGIGKIYWNESNTFSQPFYGQLGGVVSYEKKRMNISLWTKNLTGTEFNTFYFKSVGNSFVQQGKPLQAGISLKIIIN
ncbi:MAG: TonB-dependent receptor, partial [Bacteroidales bacterium]|nr:TonB-dependent receptor [Bacteroidales bacterium]